MAPLICNLRGAACAGLQGPVDSSTQTPRLLNGKGSIYEAVVSLPSHPYSPAAALIDLNLNRIPP